jgi:prepilin-type N-terminal cleavage/methylation domain-containing protein
LKNNKNEKQQGFTLVEMVATISIMMLISSLILANYRSGEKSIKLSSAANQLASRVRLAENYAINLKEDQSGTVPAGGWGVYVQQGTGAYFLFKDSDGSGDCANNCNSASPERSQSFVLPNNITVTAINPNNAGRGNIAFNPPDPNVLVNGLNDTDIEITIRSSENNNTKKIKVNSYGLVEQE